MREPLARSRDDRMFLGVAGGMAEWLDLDPAIVRLVWVLLTLAGGAGVLLYLVAAIVIPAASERAGTGTPAAAASPEMSGAESRDRRAARRGRGNPGIIFGLVLVIAGSWFLLDRYLPTLDLSWFMPGALIVIGLVLVVGALGRSGRTEG